MNPSSFIFDYSTPFGAQGETLAPARPVLRVDPTARETLLVDDGGRPVWPAGAPGALETLHKIVAICGGTVEVVTGRPATGPADGSALVVALGHEVMPVAAMYAHLTGRAVVQVAKVVELRALQHVEVVVTTFDDLTLELMEALYPFSPDGDAVPGIIAAADVAALWSQALVRSAAGAIVGPAETRRIELLMPANVGKAVISGVEVLGGTASVSAIRNALAGGSGILGIVGHSDGFDTFLGSAILCGVEGKRESTRGAPACEVTGHCHRLQAPVTEARATERLVAPETIATRILSYMVCAGTLLEDSSIDLRRGLIVKLLANPSIGAILTPWSVILASDLLALRLSDELARGTTVGNALALFHSSIAAHEVGTRMCLFGDPRVSLPASYFEPALFAERPPKAFAPSTSPVGCSDLVVLQRCMEAGAAGGASPSAPGSSGTSPEDAVTQYVMAVVTGQDPEREPDGVGHQMRSALLDYALELGMLPWNVWVPAANPVTGHDLARPCPHCARVAVALRFEFEGAPDRRLVFCARCGTAEDCPFDAPSLGLTLEDDSSVTIEGPLPVDAANCLLMVRSANQSVCCGFQFRIPAEAAARNRVSVKAPFAWPPGQGNLALVVFVRDSFRVYSIPVWTPTARSVFPELQPGTVVVT